MWILPTNMMYKGFLYLLYLQLCVKGIQHSDAALELKVVVAAQFQPIESNDRPIKVGRCSITSLCDQQGVDVVSMWAMVVYNPISVLQDSPQLLESF